MRNLMIYFLISAIKGVNTGSGGHYYSLTVLCRNLQEPYCIIVIGDFFPEALRGPVENNVSLIPETELANTIVREHHNIRVLHAFDRHSAYCVRRLARGKGIPLVVTKPGGYPLKFYHPKFKNNVVYQPADYVRSLLSPLVSVNCTLITNRVNEQELLAGQRPRVFQRKESIKILRICRITSVYSESICQAAALCRAMKSHGFDVEFSVIGTVQDKAVYDYLQREVGDIASFYTEPTYTRNASQLIRQCTAAIASGRGLMESMTLGKPSLVAVAGETLPSLVVEQNFDALLSKNFSPRITIQDTGTETLVSDLEALFSSPNSLRKYAKFAQDKAYKHFEMSGAIPTYMEIYRNAEMETWFYSALFNVAHTVEKLAKAGKRLFFQATLSSKRIARRLNLLK